MISSRSKIITYYLDGNEVVVTDMRDTDRTDGEVDTYRDGSRLYCQIVSNNWVNIKGMPEAVRRYELKTKLEKFLC